MPDTVHAIFRAYPFDQGRGRSVRLRPHGRLRARPRDTARSAARRSGSPPDSHRWSHCCFARPTLSAISLRRSSTGQPGCTRASRTRFLSELDNCVAPGTCRNGEPEAHNRRPGKIRQHPPTDAGPLRASASCHMSGLYRNANEPLLLIRELKRIGEATWSSPIFRCLPLAGAAWSPRTPTSAGPCELWTSVHELARIEEIFDFVTDHCDLKIECRNDGRSGHRASGWPRRRNPAPRRSTASLPVASPQKIEVQAIGRNEAHAAPTTVRVDVQKVDRLVNLVGELVINQAMLVQFGRAAAAGCLCPELIGGLETLSQHLRGAAGGGDGDTHPAGWLRILTHAATGARAFSPSSARMSTSSCRWRRHRDRQDGHRAARGSAHPSAPQRARSRRRDT